MKFSIATLAALAASISPAIASASPGNVTFSATFKDGSSEAIAGLHEGAGFSFFFAYDTPIYYSFDWQDGFVYTPLGNIGGEGASFMALEINSPYVETSANELSPLTLSISNESSVFWYLDRPTGGANKLHGILKSESAPVKFYAAKNYTYDPYQYSQSSYMIAAGVEDLDYLDVGGAIDVQEVDIWATIIQE